MSGETASQEPANFNDYLSERDKRMAQATTPAQRDEVDQWGRKARARIATYDSRMRAFNALPEDAQKLVLDVAKSAAKLGESKGAAQQQLDSQANSSMISLLTSAEQGIINAKLSIEQSKAGIYGIFGMVSVVARFFGATDLANRIDNYISEWNPNINVNTSTLNNRIGKMVVGEHSGHLFGRNGTAARATGGLARDGAAGIGAASGSAEAGVEDTEAPAVRTGDGLAPGSNRNNGQSIDNVLRSIRAIDGSKGVDTNEKVRLDKAARMAAGTDGKMSDADLTAFEESRAFKALSPQERRVVDLAVRQSLAEAAPSPAGP